MRIALHTMNGTRTDTINYINGMLRTIIRTTPFPPQANAISLTKMPPHRFTHRVTGITGISIKVCGRNVRHLCPIPYFFPSHSPTLKMHDRANCACDTLWFFAYSILFSTRVFMLLHNSHSLMRRELKTMIWRRSVCDIRDYHNRWCHGNWLRALK